MNSMAWVKTVLSSQMKYFSESIFSGFIELVGGGWLTEFSLVRTSLGLCTFCLEKSDAADSLCMTDIMPEEEYISVCWQDGGWCIGLELFKHN